MAVHVNQPVPSSAGEGIVFASLSRAAATYNSAEFDNFGARGIRLFINATISGGGTLDVKLQNFDPASAAWYDTPTGASIVQLVATGSIVLTVYPGIATTANKDVSQPLGMRWRVVAVIGTAATTFSIGADYLN
jgi:hypothetical protein